VATNVNVGTVRLTRGKSTLLGTIASLSSVVQFNIPEPTRDNQGFLIVQSVGTAGTTPTLEGSLDGGVTWFVMSTSATVVLNTTGLVTGDNAAATADAYQVSGMGAGCLFRFGFLGGSPNCTVWALVG
jgi:hypothetical protein